MSRIQHSMHSMYRSPALDLSADEIARQVLDGADDGRTRQFLESQLARAWTRDEADALATLIRWIGPGYYRTELRAAWRALGSQERGAFERPAAPDALYNGKVLRFVAVVDDLGHGRTWAAAQRVPDLPVRSLFGTPRAIRELALPPHILLLYPEHELVVKQQGQLVQQVVAHVPQVHAVTIVSTSPIILQDAWEIELLRNDV